MISQHNSQNQEKINRIKNLLSDLSPVQIKVEDESYKHQGHYESSENTIFPSHVKITIISDMFTGVSLVQRHKLVNFALASAFTAGLHAAQITARAPDE